MKKTTAKKLNLPFIGVMVVFVLPMLIGAGLYFFHDHFQFKTTNHGILVTPPIQAQYLQNAKKWSVVQVADEVCDSQCHEVNFKLSQLQKALGKNRDRVEIILLSTQIDPIIHLSHNFDEHGEKNFIVTHKIYLIDPLGNLFMYYPDSVNPMDILKDLKKVLEVSQIG